MHPPEHLCRAGAVPSAGQQRSSTECHNAVQCLQGETIRVLEELPVPSLTVLGALRPFPQSMYMTRQAMLAGAGGGVGGPGLGGRTPHLGGRTPNPAAGGRTPAQTGTTPYGSRSPYVHRGAPPPQAHQMRPQTPQYMAQQQQQYQPPPPGPPAQPSGGAFMHPSRMQQAGFGR